MAPVNRPQMRNRFGGAAPTPTKEPEIEDLIAQARLLAEKSVPSFIPGLRASTIVVDELCPSIAIDQYWRTYWNPRAVQWMVRAAEAVSATDKCPTCGASTHHKLAYLTGIWIHEIGHCVFKHKDRFENQGWTDHDKWNIAADAEMNDDIPEIGRQSAASEQAKGYALPQMCLPKKVVVSQQEWNMYLMLGSANFKAVTGKDIWEMFQPYKTTPPPGHVIIPSFVFPDQLPTGPGQWMQMPEGKIAEVYYESMPDLPKQQGQQGQGQPGQGQSQAGSGLGDLADHGSGVSGERRAWEDGKPGETNADGKPNAPGINPAEGKAIRRDVATKIKQSSNGRGNVPAGWEVWADTELQVPKVRWQDKVRALARMAINRIRGEKQTTFRRLARGSIVQDCKVIKPSTYDIVPTVIIGVDTSGSMGAGRRSRLERALSECEAIIKLNKVKAYFMDGDARPYGDAQDVRSVRSAKVHGGGGTDMGALVRAMVKQKVKPDLIILLTDGDTPWPSPEDLKGKRIITGIVHESGINGCPAYMNPIHIDTDD